MLDAAAWTARLHELAEPTSVTGAVLGIWADGQEILVAYGMLNAATRVPVTTDSLFQVGSITKLWTASMIMQLIDEGRLSLDTTVAGVLPGVQLGAKDIGGQVTVAHLLTHTSGIDGDIFTDTGRGDGCVRRYVDLLADAASAYPAGDAYSYCNSGWVLLGRIIEVLDGRPWDRSLQARLVHPLGLAQTVTLPEEAIMHRVAVGHRDGVPVTIWGLPRSVGPAGGIVGCAHDLLTFARMHLDRGIAPDGSRTIGEASVSAMQQPRAAIPNFALPDAAIGLGWRMSRWGSRTIIGHDGDTIGQSAYLRVDPAAGAAACLLTNSSESASLYRAVFAEVVEDWAGITMPADPEPADSVRLADEDLGRHAGRYERTSRRFDVSVRDGRLRIVITTTGDLATLTDAEPEELVLYPADSSGANFLCRSQDDDPWTPLSFARLPDGTPYVFMSGRVTPRA
jgi:CubicO group peptidase (beta-lactamase class C family)